MMYLNINGAIGPCDIVHIHNNTGVGSDTRYSIHRNTHKSAQLYRIATGSFVVEAAVVPSTRAAFGPWQQRSPSSEPIYANHQARKISTVDHEENDLPDLQGIRISHTSVKEFRCGRIRRVPLSGDDDVQ